MDGPPGLVESSDGSGNEVGLHTFCIHPNKLQEPTSEYGSEASSREEEKQPKMSQLTGDETSEEEECPILEEPQRLGPFEGFLVTSPAVKVRGILLGCNAACNNYVSLTRCILVVDSE